MPNLRRFAFLMVLLVPLALAACDTAEERAEKHYQSSLALLEENDVARALVELRNVFQLDDSHREARRLYAKIMRDQGRLADAQRQYVRLVEQYPQDLEGLRAASEIALSRQDWTIAERFIPTAYKLAPEDAGILAMKTALDYRQAVLDEDSEAAAKARTQAEALLKELPDNLPVREVEIDALLKENDLQGALAEIDRAIELDPDNLRYHEMKLQILSAQGDNATIGAYLQELSGRFPQNDRIRDLLISWYVSEGRIDEAEDILRDVAENAEPDERQAANVTLLQFLRRAKGPAAATAEAERLIASVDEPILYQTMRAAMLFDSGTRDQAILDLQAAIETAAPSKESRDAKVTLAKMLEQTGDMVGARARVEDVLTEDSTHAGALKMRGRWLIEDDRATEAIAALRSALEGAPDDSEILLLMARAHLREGNRQLAGERLATAVNLSGQGARESLAYAEFLVQDDKQDLAESVLVTALRKAPQDLQLLQQLGQLYLAQSDWIRAQNIIRHLKEMDGREAQAIANGLQTSLLLRQEKTEESTAFLQDLIDRGDASLEAAALIVQNHLKEGDVTAARDYVDGLLETSPDDPRLLFLKAGLEAVSGNADAAEASYRALLETTPGEERVVHALFSLLLATDRPDEADAVLAKGIEASNGNPKLRMLQASRFETQGAFEKALEIYGDLYDEFSDSVVLANNLASLLSNQRDDEESFQRAVTISRRLRGTQIPPFQDTYGWIEYRRGNIDEALLYLAPAARQLPQNFEVQAHLGLAYAAAERPDEARSALSRAIELGGEADSPLIAQAREALAALPSPAPAPEPAPSGEGSGQN